MVVGIPGNIYVYIYISIYDDSIQVDICILTKSTWSTKLDLKKTILYEATFGYES